jgi:uncharacterized protein (TIGR02611 family)
MSKTPDPTEPDEHGLFDRLDDFRDRIEEAAIQAEFETGEREETVEEARANALVRLGRMTLGTIVVIVGIIALPLPGPGWLIIAGGLTILSKDVAWADRLLRYIRKRVPGIPEDGKIPRSSLATMALVTLAAVSASLWWTLARGSDEIQAGAYVATELDAPSQSTPVVDPGIEIDLTTEGPVTVRVAGCDPVDFDVIDRSKDTFELARPNDSEWACADEDASRFIAGLTENELQLEYTTDGIVSWFFADDELSSISGGGEAGEFEFLLMVG